MPEPLITEVRAGMRLFRGMKTPVDTWSPLEPRFGSVVDWETFTAIEGSNRLGFAHVLADLLGEKQQKAVSLSAQLRVARFYATSTPRAPRARQGIVGVFRVPPITRILYCSGRPYLYVCEGDVVIFDPRTFWGTTAFVEAAGAALFLQQTCSRVDDELLLVHGKLVAETLIQAAPHTFTDGFEPWQHTLKRLGHAVPNPPIPSLREIDAELETDDENIAAIFT